MSKLRKFKILAKLTGFFKHFEDLLLDSISTFKVLRSTKVTENLLENWILFRNQ